MDKLLEIDQVNYSYHNLEGETKAVKDLSLKVMDGEFISIVGPSGCGNAMV